MIEPGADTVITNLRGELRGMADPKREISHQRYFKEPVRAYGVPNGKVLELARKTWQQIKQQPKADILGLCDALWQSGYMEESFIACDWAYALRRKFEPADFIRWQTWVHSYVDNWASCDTLCNHTVGTFITMYPQFAAEVVAWSSSDNRWARRAAAVTFIVPARKGLFLAEIFQVADLLLADTDDLVQKGYGWALKTASESSPQEVYEFVTSRHKTMPRTAFRYALEKLPAEMRAAAMRL